MKLFRIPRLTNPRVFSSRIILVLSLFLVFSGCSVYQNVTSYFNTYYNLKKIYGEAVDEINKSRQADQDTNYFAPYNLSKGADDKFEKVIEKCSRLLQFYPQSQWVDDAVLIIGKSYVYKGEGESGRRKFNELLENFPTSDLRFEAKLWRAKAEYFINRDDEALKTINELVSDDQISSQDDIALEALMLQGQIYVERNEYNQAAESYGKAAERQGDGYLRAMARFQLGQNYERVGEYAKAAEAYEKVRDDKPDYGLDYRTRLRHGVMLTKMEKFEQALDSFERLEEEQLKPEEIAMVELEIANTYNEMGDTTKAFAVYTFIDTTYKKSDASAKSCYQRALTYEKKFMNFANARSFYDMASNEFAGSSITNSARQKADDFGKYFSYHANITKYDTLLFRALHPDTSKTSTVGFSGADDSSKPKPTASIASDTLHQQIDSLLATSKNTVTDTTQNPLQPPELSPSEPEAKVEKDEPDVRRNMNRRTRERDDDSTDIAEGLPDNEQDTVLQKIDSTKNRRKISQKHEPLLLSPDSLRMRMVQNEFELAGLFLLELNLPDSARYWYEKVITDDSNSAFVPRSIYALAEIYGSTNDSTAVDSLYQVLLTRYEDSEYANQVRRLLGMEAARVKIDSAESKYQEAANLLTGGSTESALKRFLSITKNYPASPFAPKATYTAGWIYENVLLNNDSAASCYRQLVKQYPASIYAANVQPKIAVKDKPESLEQYVKTKEIQLMQKEGSPLERKQGGKGLTRGKGRDEGDHIQKGRGKDRGEDDEDTDEDEPEPPDPDDDNN